MKLSISYLTPISSNDALGYPLSVQAFLQTLRLMSVCVQMRKPSSVTAEHRWPSHLQYCESERTAKQAQILRLSVQIVVELSAQAQADQNLHYSASRLTAIQAFKAKSFVQQAVVTLADQQRFPSHSHIYPSRIGFRHSVLVVYFRFGQVILFA